MSAVKVVSVDVIIVTYKTPALTQRALAALYRSTARPKNIFLIDNNSGDDTVTRVKTLFPHVNIIQNKENVGFAKANNQALCASQEKYVWLLNSDTETGSRSLEDLYNFMEAHPTVGAAGPQLVYPDKSLQSTGGSFPTPLNVGLYLLPASAILPRFIKRGLGSLAMYPQIIPRAGKKVDYVTGAALMLRRQALTQVGLLAEDYFMYFEEVDLCWRLQLAGWERFVVFTEPVMHVYGGSFKKRHDAGRLRIFLNSLKIFINNWYRGPERALLLWEIRLFGWVSIFLKRLRR